jgi:hypothetical protein
LEILPGRPRRKMLRGIFKSETLDGGSSFLKKRNKVGVK